MASPRIKVCCIADPTEANMAIAAGASALGLVSAMPSGPGAIADVDIARIAREIPPGIASFLLTALTDAEAIIEQHQHCHTNTLQLVDHVAASVHRKLRQALPGIGLVQVVHVLDQDSVEQALEYASLVDALLLDSGNPTLSVKQLGGTGRTHDWALSRQIVERVAKPVYLAGGLNPHNVAAAIAAVRPFGVDLCSGVRVDGHLDSQHLGAFVEAVRSAA